MSFATAEEFLQRYDARIVGDLVADDGDQVTSSALLSDTNLQAALNAPSGDIEAACMVGERYVPADLAALTGNSLYLLKRICCDIAMAFLLRRRPSNDPERDAARLELAEQHLIRLRKGEEVFYRGDGVDQAGIADMTGPSSIQLENLNTIRRRARNYYPQDALPFCR